MLRVQHRSTLCWGSDVYPPPPPQAQKHVSGELLFRLIEDENTLEAVALLKQTQRVCESFKSVFARFKVRAETLLGAEAWATPKVR